MEMGDIELAQRHLQMVPDMPAPVEVRALARNGLREIAVSELKAREPRMDAVFYLLDAMRLFFIYHFLELLKVIYPCAVEVDHLAQP
jgi:hypothetical protein